jgi:hypothetical protein
MPACRRTGPLLMGKLLQTRVFQRLNTFSNFSGRFGTFYNRHKQAAFGIQFARSVGKKKKETGCW